MTNTFFVTADWLSAHLSDDDVQLIDARMPPAGQENLRDIHAEFIA
ncbi:MAG: sulfurtransferase, partial [Enterobacterales bacterium]|nr:sulfurtransferase [Enterobacterales bacterium]